MGLVLNPETYSKIELAPLVQGILDRVDLCTMSTVNQDGTAHVNTAFFCTDSEWRMFFVSDEKTKHSQNINERSSMAVAVCRSDQDWNDWKVGLQLFGKCKMARGSEAELGARLYKKRFPAYAVWLQELGRDVQDSGLPRFFKFVPKSVKLLHEEVLGEETFVTVGLSRE